MDNFSETLKHIHILVAEDDRLMRKLVRDMLRIVGFQNVTVVGNGEEALEVLQQEPVDLAICDWKMYPMNGLEFVQTVRRMEEGSSRFLPIIMLTGRGERQDVEIARDAGVTEYLIKPFSSDALFKRIKAVIDAPRDFVIAASYVGPDRRRKDRAPPEGKDRRNTNND